jgi:hypothetical protein
VSDDKKIYVQSHPLPGPRSGALTKFDPGTRTLKAGFKGQTWPNGEGAYCCGLMKCDFAGSD